MKRDINWSAVDWTRRDIEIARELGFSREYIRQKRMGQGLVSARRVIPAVPYGAFIRGSVNDTAIRYNISRTTAKVWHDLLGEPVGVSGRPPKAIPDGFTPERNPHRTAIKYGVSDLLAKRWHKEAGAKHTCGPPSIIHPDDDLKDIMAVYGVSRSTAAKWLKEAAQRSTPGPIPGLTD